MSALIPVAAWARRHGLTNDTALNMVRAGKIPGATRRAATVQRWFVPADARPNFADRRYKPAQAGERPDAPAA